MSSSAFSKAAEVVRTARRERRFNRLILLCFLGAAVAGVGYTFVYWYDGNIQLLGLALGICLLLFAAGLIVWSHHFMPEGPFHEDYPDLRSPAREEAEVLARVDRGGIGRRRLLIGSVGAIGASLAAGVVSDVRSFGPGPYSLEHTPWRGGRKMVTPDGTTASIKGFPVGGILTVYPEGFTDSPDAVAAVIHVPKGLNHPRKGLEGWAPDGFICYSKVCSHAGCTVSLFNHQLWQLQCPCHQSTFDVLYGAKPVFGPAGSPLAQLPVGIDSDGTLHSTGDFDFPPGPPFWHYDPKEPT